MLCYSIFWSGQLNVFFFFTLENQIALYTIAEIVGSYWLALIFQASHVVSEVGSESEGTTPYNGLYSIRGGSARKGYLFHPSFKRKDREEGQQGLTDAFYCCEKVEKMF